MEGVKSDAKKIKEEKAYTEGLKKDNGYITDNLELSDIQKHFLRSRSLDQVYGWKVVQTLHSGTSTDYGSLQL